MDLLHVVLLVLWKKQRNSLRQRSESFYIQRLFNTRFTQATPIFKKMRTFVRLKDEIWRMILAYVDKLAKYKIGVKFLLVRQDLFDGTLDAKRMKTKDSTEKVKTF